MSQTCDPRVTPEERADPAGPAPNGTKMRALNVPVPEEVYWHVRAMALRSRLPFKKYMARFLAEAWPFPPDAEAFRVPACR